MKLQRKFKVLLEVAVLVILILLDQLTKYLAVVNLKGESPVVIIKNIVELTYLENTGAAFGILANKIILFAILTFIILGAIIYFKIKIDNLIYKKGLEKKLRMKYLFLSWVLVTLFTGAIGNFIDRIRLNYVVDFIRFKFIDFPVFNIADILITCSSVLLIIMLIFVFKSEEFDLLNSKEEETDAKQ